MKKLLLLFSLLVPSLGFAQSYSIDWYIVSGGGGTSTGGVYSVSGTIGQHDASGPMTGGSYWLTGGFWSLYAVPMPGAPLLTITLTTTNTAMVSWPFPSSGFLLESTPTLSPPNWQPAVEALLTNNGLLEVLVPVNPGSRYFRLHKP